MRSPIVYISLYLFIASGTDVFANDIEKIINYGKKQAVKGALTDMAKSKLTGAAQSALSSKTAVPPAQTALPATSTPTAVAPAAIAPNAVPVQNTILPGQTTLPGQITALPGQTTVGQPGATIPGGVAIGNQATANPSLSNKVKTLAAEQINKQATKYATKYGTKYLEKINK